MSGGVLVAHAGDDAAEVHSARGALLLRYVVKPATPQDEAPRPYAHPVCSLAGEVLTNFRPNDHRWHHGLNFTIGSVSGVNFWGGPSYKKGDGYQWRNDQGAQQHVAWRECGPERLAHAVEWRANGELILAEERVLTPTVVTEKMWTLRWQAELRNVSGRELSLGNYHSREGLAGSHYTGLQFRGARDLLDRHGDPEIRMSTETGATGEPDVNGAAARWLEWRAQKDTSLRRLRIRFENKGEALHWFVREGNPLVAFPFQFARDLPLPAGEVLRLDHLLTFEDE